MKSKQFKIIITGNSNVGKTCLLKQFTKNEFKSDYQMTVGVEFESKDIVIGSENVTLQIWDTSIIKSRASYDQINTWYHDAQQHCRDKTVFALVGSKCDLDNKRQVKYEEGQEKMNELNLDMFFETSSKNNTNVSEMFYQAASKIIEFQSEIKNTEDLYQRKLQQPRKNSQQKKSGCC